MGTTRRANFLRSGWRRCCAWHCHVAARAADPVFPHGVAIGSIRCRSRDHLDPRGDHASPSPGRSRPTARFTDVVRSGSASTPTAATDHTVKVDVDGLQPVHDLLVPLQRRGAATSRDRAHAHAAEPGAAVDRARIGVVTCAEWEFGQFGAYRMVAERDDLDVVLALGDYIYEFGNDYGRLDTVAPARRTQSPAAARTAHARRLPGALPPVHEPTPRCRNCHAAHAVIAIYDDHEVANDWYTNGAEQHSAGEGDWVTRAQRRRCRPIREYLPIRVDAVDRRRSIGASSSATSSTCSCSTSASIATSSRTNAVVGYVSVDPATDDPNRTMLGATQKAWLLDGLTSSTAAWKVLGNPDAMMPIDVGPALAGALSAALSPLASRCRRFRRRCWSKDGTATTRNAPRSSTRSTTATSKTSSC